MGSKIDPSRLEDDRPVSKADLRGALDNARRELNHGGFVQLAQAGSGGVERTTRDKLAETVSIFDYGVRPDSDSDSTAAFERAFAELTRTPEAGGRNKTLLVPSGRYHLAECRWTGGPAIMGEPGQVGGVQIFYAGRGGKGSAVIKLDDNARGEINQTTISNMQIHGYNQGDRKLAESGIRLQRKVDWPFGVNNCFILTCGRYGVFLEGNHFNTHFLQFRFDKVGHYGIYTTYDKDAGEGRPLSVYNWTFHNHFGDDAALAQLWVDQGYIDANPVKGGWFGKGLVGSAGKSYQVFIGPGRAEQEERPHRQFGLFSDVNTTDGVSSVTLVGCGGFFHPRKGGGYLVYSEQGRLDATVLGNCQIRGQKGVVFDNNSKRAVAALNRSAGIVTYSGHRLQQHRGGLIADGPEVAGVGAASLNDAWGTIAGGSLLLDPERTGVNDSWARRVVNRGTAHFRADVPYVKASGVDGKAVNVAKADFDPDLPLATAVSINGREATVVGSESGRYLLDRDVGKHGATTINYARYRHADIRACGGTTAQRPRLTAEDVGVTYWDLSRQKLVVWDGSRWRLPDGGDA
jgi:hypothetical protein